MSKKPYNPLEKPAFPEEVVRKHFGKGSDSALAAKLHDENPQLYDALRIEAERIGAVGPRPYFRPQDVPQKTGKHEVTPAEQACLAEFDEATCVAFFKIPTGKPGSKNAAKLAQTDKAAYDRLKVAARARGILPQENMVEVRDNQAPAKKSSAGDGKFALAPELCVEAGLPLDTRVTLGEFSKVTAQIASNRRQRPKPADDAKPTEPPADGSKGNGDGNGGQA